MGMQKQIKTKMQGIWRQRRMKDFIRLMPLKNGSKIIDLGGLPEIWETIDLSLDITLLNLSNAYGFNSSKEHKNWKQKFTFVQGDACDASEFADNSFDIVFSNSVIEHVGDEEKRAAFAKNVRRLAPNYWVQTPCKWFPLEPHSDVLFWWFYPEPLKQAVINYWKKRPRPERFKANFMPNTTVLDLSELQLLFPEAKVYREYVYGFIKSYSMYRNCEVDNKIK